MADDDKDKDKHGTGTGPTVQPSDNAGNPGADNKNFGAGQDKAAKKQNFNRTDDPQDTHK